MNGTHGPGLHNRGIHGSWQRTRREVQQAGAAQESLVMGLGIWSRERVGVTLHGRFGGGEGGRWAVVVDARLVSARLLGGWRLPSFRGARLWSMVRML
jgi:hypothetical protein